MRLPDPRRIFESPRRVLRAFPWTVGAALVLCTTLCALNHLHGQDPDQFLSRLSMAAGWGVSLFFLAEIVTRERTRWIEMALRTAPMAILGLWFALVEHPLGTAQWSQFALLGAATHLAVSLAHGGTENRFWQWNRVLFQRVVESIAFSAVLGAGASGALWTLEKLFSVDLPNETWGDLWIFVWTVFFTFHFLSGIPNAADGTDDGYPVYLKLFSTRVLLPLAIVYLVLLYVYAAKILVTWSLPVGLVSTPILAFAGFGILAQLLLHPLAQEESDRWVRLWTRWFHLLLLPLCVLLAVAIGRRLLDYGLTEERYAVLVLAIWLPVQAIWFLSGRRSLRFVPASLLALCLLCGWGPWGAFEASRSVQLSRLEGMLSEIGAVPGQKLTKTISRSQAKKIGSVVEYLCEHHQGRGLEKWSPSVERLRKADDARESDRYGGDAMTDSVLASMGIPRIHRWEADTSGARDASLHWNRGVATFPARTRLKKIDVDEPSPSLVGMRIVLEKAGLRLVFSLDTLVNLASDGSARKELGTPLVLRDSSGRADLVLEHASLHQAGNGKWTLEKVSGLLLR